MVFKYKAPISLVALFSIVTTSFAPAAWAQNIATNSDPTEIKLVWAKTLRNDPKCQALVERFLKELRSIAQDRSVTIDLEANSVAPAGLLKLTCTEPVSAETLELVESPTSKWSMHYLTRADGFDAADWLRFQREYLEGGVRPNAIVSETQLAPVGPPPLGTTTEISGIQKTVAESPSKSVFQKWWFWGIIAGVGVGTFFGVKALTDRRENGRINVEIR